MFQTEEERIKVNAIRQVLTILGLIFGFIVPLLFTVIITLLTVAFQTIKAATANPVDSLRNE